MTVVSAKEFRRARLQVSRPQRPECQNKTLETNSETGSDRLPVCVPNPTTINDSCRLFDASDHAAPQADEHRRVV